MGNINGIPVLSQIKSLVQVIGGDEEGAKKTQEEFLRTAPVFAEVNTVVKIANGEDLVAGLSSASSNSNRCRRSLRIQVCLSLSFVIINRQN